MRINRSENFVISGLHKISDWKWKWALEHRYIWEIKYIEIKLDNQKRVKIPLLFYKNNFHIIENCIRMYTAGIIKRALR